MFFTAALPQFVRPGAGSVPLLIIMLGAVFVLVALLLDNTWALVAGSARTWCTTNPRRMKGTTRAGGVGWRGWASGWPSRPHGPEGRYGAR